MKSTRFDGNKAFLSHCKGLDGKVHIRLYPAIVRAHRNLISTVYIIFCIWDVFEVVMIYFFVVETRGFTLEEINEIFEHPNPPSYSQHLLEQRERKGDDVGVETVV